MPCEPVTSGVPARPSSPNSSSLSFRMKRVDSGGGGGGARRALTALGANDTKLNLRLAKSLLTISQDKFAKKWNFDPVMEVPLAQGRFSWTPTSSSPSAVGTLSGLDLSSSYRLLEGLTSSGSSGSSGPRAAAASHDLATAATTEAEDNAAALRTCLNLPESHTASVTIPAQVPVITGAPCQESRVPPIHPDEPTSPTSPIGPRTSCSSGPTTVSSCAVSGEPASVDEATQIYTYLSPCPNIVGSSTSSDSGVPAGDAIKGPPPSVDSEVGAEAVEDNQCGKIDPSTPLLPPTDDRRQQSTGPQTQTCITNYLHPRKRSSAHLQEVVHPSKAKKVLRAA